MADDVRNIRINYSSTGLKTMTRQVRRYNKETRQMITETQRFDRHAGTWDTTTRNIRNMGQETRNTSNKFRNMGTNVKGLAMRFVGLQAIVGYAMRKFRELIDWIKESIKKFRKFETSVAEVSTILQGTANEDIPELEAAIENLSMKFGKGANDLAKGMYDILSAAFSSRDAVVLLTAATKASIAGLSDVATSVDAITSVLNAYGKSAYQATQVSDVMFQTVIRGKLRYEDLAHAMGYIAPIAANLGVEFREIAAALTSVTRQGQHVDMATRGLALGLQNIADITPKAAKAAMKYNVNLSATALRVGGLKYIIEELNRAMHEHGAKVLPQMISNMRSLRVFMALAGDEGVAGFVDDLGRMETAVGKTQEAMNKMLQTSKRQAEMLDMSFQKLERDIGEAWSNLDIWWKKVSLWWGTFLSGGDADKATENHNRYIRSMESDYNRMMLSMDMTKRTSEDLYTTLLRYNNALDTIDELGDKFGELSEDQAESLSKARSFLDEYRGGITQIIDETVNWSNVNEFLKTTMDKNAAALEKVELEQFSSGIRETFKGNIENMRLFADNLDVPISKIEKLNKIMQKEGTITEENVKFVKDFFQTHADIDISDAITDYKELAGAAVGFISDIMGIDMRGINWEQIMGSTDLKHRSGILASAIGDIEDRIADFDRQIQEVEPDFTEVKGTFDSLTEALRNQQYNMLELSKTIDELDTQLYDLYETMGGHEFTGRMRWQLAVESAKIALDRFQKYSEMAIKYGDEMETGFMSGIQNAIDRMKEEYPDIKFELPELEWVQEDILKQIDMEDFTEALGEEALSEYDTLMEAVIGTMRDYEKVKEDVTDAEKEYNDVLEEINKENLRLNLQYQEIQLRGMMRRRGNTRAEERTLKKIEIEKTKNRIEQMKEQLDYQKKHNEAMNEEFESAYDEAESIYKEYVDRVKFYLWELEDARDTEVEHLITNISRQEGYYDLYQGWVEDTADEIVLLQGEIMTLANYVDEEVPRWEEFFGITAIEMAKEALGEINDEVDELLKKLGKRTTPKPEPTLMPEAGEDAEDYKRKVDKFVDEYRKRNFPKSELPGREGTHYAPGLRGGRQRGGYIPETAPYLLHRGEHVIPAGKETSGDVNITIYNTNTMNNEIDAEAVARKQAEAIMNKLSDKTGKTKYRWR